MRAIIARRIAGQFLAPVLILFLSGLLSAADRPALLLVLGAPGTEDYERKFRDWSLEWQKTAAAGAIELHTVGQQPVGESADRELLKHKLTELAVGDDPLWLVLIGHGTFDRKTARFNLRGPDVTAAELAEWLKPVTRPLVIIDCSAASGPFLPALKGKNRIVVTATRSGSETNFAWFGEYISRAVSSKEADFDGDNQTSLLEATLWASARTAERYKNLGQIVTEHAALDDNGDGFGTRTDAFEGLRPAATKLQGKPADGRVAARTFFIPAADEINRPAAWRRRRDEFENQLSDLRDRQSEFSEAEYYQKLEAILIPLARLYEEPVEDENK